MDSEGGKIAQVHKKYGNTMYITVSLPFRFSECQSFFFFYLAHTGGKITLVYNIISKTDLFLAV